MIYDITKGYGLQFTKFDEQYQDTIIYRDTKEEIIRLADIILLTFDRRGLMSQLNDMQCNTHYYNAEGNMTECELFADKFEIPAYFINLILSKYGMCVRGWENDIPRINKKK
jgi:hypothetical protein